MGITLTIILGVIAGIITASLIELGKVIYTGLTHRKFKAVFGTDLFSSEGMHLVYAQFALQSLRDENGSTPTHPYVKPEETAPGVFFSIERPVSSCELRAAKYLSEIMAKDVNRSPSLSSDFDLSARLNISFVAFGGPASNNKSRDALTNEANEMLTFGEPNFVVPLSRRAVLRTEPQFDYGLILKIHPAQFPERTWLVCAGIGEWGTSGAAWYLAHKWREIYPYSKSDPFAIIIRVRPQQDEAAVPVIRVKNAADAEAYAESLGL